VKCNIKQGKYYISLYFTTVTFIPISYDTWLLVHSSSSSSSLARQPYVGPGLPQKLLPAKYLANAFSDFVTRVSSVGLSAPRPTLGYPGGPLVLYLVLIIA
jgi:hypothetical protein